MIMLASVTVLFALSIGIAVLLVNPKRITNQAFAFLSLLLVLEFGMVFGAIRASAHMDTGGVASPIPWLKGSAVVTGLFPLALWLIKESIAMAGNEKRKIIYGAFPWLLLAAFLAILCLSESFIPENSPEDNPARGFAYTIRTAILMAALLALVANTVGQLKKVVGIRRVEMRFLVLNGGVTALLSIALVSFGVFLKIPELKGLGMVVTLIGYAVMAWAMTVHRVFDARQVFLSLGQRALMIVALALGVFGLNRLFDDLFGSPISVLVSIALCTLVVFRLDRMFRSWLGLGGEQVLAAARTAVMQIATTEPDSHRLKAAFERFLARHCQTAFAALVTEPADPRVSGLRIGGTRPGIEALCKNQWATPESLERLRASAELEDLDGILAANSLGLILTAPRGTSVPSLILALGMKTDQWPYTYPEVQRLQDIAELMDNLLTHSRLITQAALKTRIDDLAMVSRGLAHDLKNLITPISSFLVHTADWFPPGSAEQEVHGSARRAIRLMTEYTRDALFFANRLEPKFESVSLGPILEAVRDLTRAHAIRRSVSLRMEADGRLQFMADGVLMQRLLANLVVNAIDSSPPGAEVVVLADVDQPGFLRLQVIDAGCGIPPENLGRIFEPYFTTKEFGDDTRGLGLGLTICQKIVGLHDGSIWVKSDLGSGTSITVELPVDRKPPSRAAAPPSPGYRVVAARSRLPS